MRMRFRKVEREAYTVGTKVEWRHGRFWYPGEVIGAVWSPAGCDMQCLPIKNLGPTTKTISTGQRVDPHPTAVRLPAAA